MKIDEQQKARKKKRTDDTKQNKALNGQDYLLGLVLNSMGKSWREFNGKRQQDAQ